MGMQVPVSVNMGDIDWLGAIANGKIENVGQGDFNYFVAGSRSKTHPNANTFELPFFSVNGSPAYNGGFGLLYNDCDPMTPGGQCAESHSGTLVYLGARYDIKPTGTKIGVEYNHGSEYWIGMVPAGDDLWTSKLGTRGNVWEVYLIQELNKKPIAKRGKAFFRLGYQYYTFKYTGSNNWVGAPQSIDSLNTMDPSKTQLLAPLKNAKDFYGTFEVIF